MTVILKLFKKIQYRQSKDNWQNNFVTDSFRDQIAGPHIPLFRFFGIHERKREGRNLVETGKKTTKKSLCICMKKRVFVVYLICMEGKFNSENLSQSSRNLCGLTLLLFIELKRKTCELYFTVNSCKMRSDQDVLWNYSEWIPIGIVQLLPFLLYFLGKTK